MRMRYEDSEEEGERGRGVSEETEGVHRCVSRSQVRKLTGTAAKTAVRVLTPETTIIFQAKIRPCELSNLWPSKSTKL